MSRIATYRAAMLARRAAAAGCTVAEFLTRGEAAAEVTRRVAELRYGGRRSGWPTIAIRAAAHGRSWAVLA